MDTIFRDLGHGGGAVVRQKDLAGSNQRVFKRFRIPIPMRFILISGEDRRLCSRFYSTTLWDLGLRGVSFTTPELALDGIHFFYNSVPMVRNRILMRIQLPDAYGTVTAMGHAVHTQILQDRERRTYLVGIHFIQMNESNGAKFRTFLSDVGKDDLSGKAYP
jgi:hypothetical protein